MTELGYLWKIYLEIILYDNASYPQEMGVVGMRATYISLGYSHIIIILVMPTCL